MKINDFDTLLLSKPIIEISNPSEVENCIKKYHSGMAHLEHNDLIETALKPDFTAQMLTLECDLGTFKTILGRLPGKYTTSFITNPDEIDLLLPLIDSTINNRFSNDPLIGPMLAVPHKRKLIQTHFNNGNSSICYSKLGDVVIGFHQMMVKKDELVLYEIATTKEHRNGLLAISLLKSALESLENKAEFADVSKVMTKIYSDNAESFQFFRKLGFRVSDSKFHSHFHFG